MRGTILIIDDGHDFSLYEGDLIGLGLSEGFEEFALAYAPTVDAAMELFFQSTPVLVIANAYLEGGRENLEMLKTEEMYRHIPVMVLTDTYDRAFFKTIYELGADAVLTYKEVYSGLLPIRAKPMLATSALFQLKIMHSSELQEKALLDFIMLDLIKPYVPLTIWETAQECAHQQKMEIKEHELELSVAFGDVKGFTQTSQKMKPSEVIRFLNSAYEVVTRYVYANGGDIDKFIGDAFFAVFKDPKAAINSMTSIQRELKVLHDERTARGEESAMFRTAVHSGKVIRGNVGGNQRFDNTLIGDTVNTASRLEHEAPLGGVLVSKEAGEKAGLEVPLDKMLVFQLRGRDGDSYAFSYFDMVDQGYIKEDAGDK